MADNENIKTVNAYIAIDWECPECDNGNVEDNCPQDGDEAECKSCGTKFILSIIGG